jgi:hypothetical protein
LIAIAARGTTKEIRKYFKYRKVEYIRRFYRNGGILIILETLKNGNILAIEGSQDEEL